LRDRESRGVERESRGSAYDRLKERGGAHPERESRGSAYDRLKERRELTHLRDSERVEG
jgi:hypothetical protein